jgi:hypothetical protein
LGSKRPPSRRASRCDGNNFVVRSLVSAERTISITGELKCQACDDKVCYPPASVPVMWNLQVLPLDLKRSPEAIRHK